MKTKARVSLVQEGLMDVAVSIAKADAQDLSDEEREELNETAGEIAVGLVKIWEGLKGEA